MNDLISNLKVLNHTEISDLKDYLSQILFNKSFSDVNDIVKDSDFSVKSKEELTYEISENESALQYYEKFDSIFEKIESDNYILLNKDDYILLNKDDYPTYYTLNDLSSNNTEIAMIRIIKKLNNDTSYLCIDLKNELFVISRKVFEDKYLKKS